MPTYVADSTSSSDSESAIWNLPLPFAIVNQIEKVLVRFFFLTRMGPI